MAEWAYDLCGAEPIIRDMIAEADTYVQGEWAAEGYTDGNDMGFAITGADKKSGLLGIFNEGITPTTNIDTPVLTEAKVIINPFAVYCAEYDQSVKIDALGAGPTHTCTTSVGYPHGGGSWLYRVLDPGAGELDLVEDSSVSSTTCTWIMANTETVAFTSVSDFIVIAGVGQQWIELGTTVKIAQDIDAGFDVTGTYGAPVNIMENYIARDSTPKEKLRNKHIGLVNLDADSAKFYADVCLFRASTFNLNVTRA